MVALSLAVLALSGCPHDASLGSLTYARGTAVHRVSLADCADRVVGQVPVTLGLTSPDGRVFARVRPSLKPKRETIWVTRAGRSRPVFSETEVYKKIGPGETPGPIELLGVTDGWVFFAIDPGGSASIASDGLTLRAVSTRGGMAHALGTMLPYQDYLTWCGGRLVFTGGRDRIATDAKRLLVAGPPRWRPRPLWRLPGRTFGSLACAPDGRSVAVLSQGTSTDADFFATRWQLWRVGLDGSHTLLDRPPTGSADESPAWSPDGRSLAFVRERQGVGTLRLLGRGRPIARLGYSLGYYGHHDWRLAWHA
jgi:hypothetical protein